MPIIVYCKSCAKKIRVPDGPPGRKGKCPQCAATLLIPTESETSPPEGATKTPREALEPVGEESAPPAPPAPKAAPTPKAEPKPEPAKASAPAPKVEPKPEPKPEPKAVPAAEKPAVLGAKKKPMRIALNMSPTDAEDPIKAARVAQEAAKKEDAEIAAGATTATLNAKPAAAKKPAPRNLKQINWAEEPDPIKKRNPMLWVLFGLIALGLGLVAWKFLTKPDPIKLSPEERKREQFQLDPGADGWKDLRGGAAKPKP